MKELTEQEIDILSRYPERQKLTRKPFGFTDKPGDPYNYIPIPEVILVLDKALDQLDAGLSLRQVTEWMNNNLPSGYSISYPGLLKSRHYYRPESLKKRNPNKVKRLTREEKKIREQRLLLAAEKRRVISANKRIEKLQDSIGIREENKVSVDKNNLFLELDYGNEIFEKVQEDINEGKVEIFFKPNPGPQTAFFAAEEMEVLYGGAAGGGKSYALIADPMRYFDNKNFSGLIVRRTNDELRELIRHTQELYPKAFPKAHWSEMKKEWTFPSGATLWMTYLEREEDVERYRGQAFTYVGFDELTQYPTPYAWNFMRSRLRSIDPDLPLFMRATSNPGGSGHGWVKKMFIDPAPYGEPFWATDIEKNTVLIDEETNEPLFKRRFIPAKVKDNPYLWNDGRYRKNLMSLPEAQRRQLLDGDWDVADGAAFPEFRQSIHVTKTTEIPRNWRRFRSCDYGYSSRQASAVLWYTVSPINGQLIVYRELYIKQLTGRQLAKKILEIEHEANERISYGVLDSSVWSQRGQSGPSIAEEMIAEGCRWKPSDRSQGSRIAGKNRLHELLRVDPETDQPGIIFHDNCRHIISTLPVIPNDKDSDDIDPDFVDDHSYDALRYGIMSRPKTSYEDWGWTTKTEKTYRPADEEFGY